MIRLSESDLRITAADYLLYRKCPRSLHRKLSGQGIPTLSEADNLYPVVSDRSRLRELLRQRFSGDEGSAAHAFGIDFDVRCAHGIFEAGVDVRHPQKPDGKAGVLVREATSIKEAYLREAAFVDYCFAACGERLERTFIYHVNKSYERVGQLDLDALFVARDVTRRVSKVADETAVELEVLRGELEADPTLEHYRDVRCSRRRTCPVCSEDLAVVEAGHVSTLHRGGRLVGELLEEGFTMIADVPVERLVHRRQQIQQKALRERVPHVDVEALRAFLDRLVYPIGYLDFEATSTAIPAFDHMRPWEHIPYLYSLHVEHTAGALAHTSFIMRPGMDDREALADRLVVAASACGSIVVYSAGFERGILRRLAEAVPAQREELTRLVERIVDLLEPFNEFSFYHHEQKGKVSLKTVLPVLTDRDYSEEKVRDGYTANLAYRYLAEGGEDRSATQAKLLSDLTSYCALDTMAMVHIVRELRQLAHDAADPSA